MLCVLILLMYWLGGFDYEVFEEFWICCFYCCYVGCLGDVVVVGCGGVGGVGCCVDVVVL